jgi:pimeloyl-ACP methyl ester carboxylesterase
MKPCKVHLAVFAVLALVSTVVSAGADPLKNIVLVHGAWVDASGWKAIYDILAKDGFQVSMVQEPETSFMDDVVATKRVLDLQDGPTLLVGHSYGGSVITEAGTHPNVVGLVYVAAHAPDVGEDEAALGQKTPTVLAKTPGAIKKTPDDFTYLNPPAFPELFAPDLPREQAEFMGRSQVLAAAKIFSTPHAVHWQDREKFNPDRYNTITMSDQVDDARCEQIGFARCPFNRTTFDVKDGRRVGLANSGFGTVYPVVNGKPVPVCDHAGYAPFGFGYRRCPGEQFTIKLFEDFLRQVWTEKIEFERLHVPDLERVPVGPGCVVADDLGFSRSS